MLFEPIAENDAVETPDVVRYHYITQMLTLLGAVIFASFLPFCFLYPHPAARGVGYFVLATLAACLLGMGLNHRNCFLLSKNLVSSAVLTLYAVSPFVLGTKILDGTLLLVFPATLFFAYRPEERKQAGVLIALALLAYLCVIYRAQPLPLWGGPLPPEIGFWIDGVSKVILFLFVAAIAYAAAQRISDHEIALAQALHSSDQLLLNILPQRIAERLKDTTDAIAEGHPQVAVLFADIAHFTPLSEQLSPEALVELLNQIFSAFDRITHRHGVEKIKTIGDAYMAAAGVPQATERDLAALADCALEMQRCARQFCDPQGRPIQLRMGLHCGPAVAGVIGAHKFAYDLWGDTVNTASRMESHGAVDKIHVSEAFYSALKDRYRFGYRGEIEIKGKGRLKTWWLEEPQ